MADKVPSEDYEQACLATWLTKQGIIFFAVPNGGKRSLAEGVKFKRTGVQAGVPDIVIPIPSGGFHGLFIEMKRSKGGILSNSQIYWLSLLRDKGYYAEVARGFNEARDIITHYLSLHPKAA
jgi:hypothetical protein